MPEDPDRARARARAVERITELVLGDPPELTTQEAAAAVGLTVDESRAYWRAMGFADVGEARAFTRGDVECLALLVGWARAGRVDAQTTVDLTRSFGQTASRLADWQMGTLVRVLEERGDPVDLDVLTERLGEVLPGLEALLVHAWRRHLAAVLARGLATADEGGRTGPGAVGTVGFADIAGFTRLARSLRDAELARMVQAFESGAADIVAAHGSRVVKTLGDEVMFVAPDARAAVGIAMEMHQLSAPGPEALSLRIGIATGRLITRMGDVYGDTVNLASRLTDVCRPSATLVDHVTAEGLGSPGPYVLRSLPPRPLRGLGLVRATSISRRRTHGR